uniref:ADP,ATP carrier protein n=1 Tax=Hemiselmis tepida TaxID=464990 RepID=A0A7S0VUZ8_9CRYP|mmetsp:Transcript_2922/g.7440  ORF Transcript_2922/g.7440 Transcript_2922/m.7440 type:complete len:383 (+) Transcript_2922:70-1218(+)
MMNGGVRRADGDLQPLPGIDGAEEEDGIDVELRPLTSAEVDPGGAEDSSNRKRLVAPPRCLKPLALCLMWSGIAVVIVWYLISIMPVEAVRAVQVASQKGFRVGVAGAAAMSVQVVMFMWMRTIINYQYRYGGGTAHVFMLLWREGGVFRLYQGLLLALIQAPLARFGDTAANEGAQSLLNASALTRDLPIGIKSMFCSFAAGLFRIVTMPVDTVKVKLQVEGPHAVRTLMGRVLTHGPGCLFHGWLANQVAAMAGHYPWFATRNYMRGVLDARRWGVYRDIAVGLCASLVSDVASNSARVLKTNIQTSDRPMTYSEAVAQVVRKDGVSGIFLRGLSAKILASAAQSVVFNVAWEEFQRMQLAGGGAGAAMHPVLRTGAPVA